MKINKNTSTLAFQNGCASFKSIKKNETPMNFKTAKIKIIVEAYTSELFEIIADTTVNSIKITKVIFDFFILKQ